MSRTQLFAAFFFAVFLYLLYQFYLVVHFFVGPLSWGAFLAFVFYPLQQWLTRLLRQRAGWAAFILTTAVILIVIVPTIYLSARLATESAAAYQRVQELIQSGQLPELLQRFRDSTPGRLWARLLPQLETLHIDLGALLLKLSNTISAFLVAQMPAAAANVLRFVVNFFFSTFALFFFFRDGERMLRGARDLIPMEQQHKDAVLGQLYDTLSAVVQGTLVTAAAQGALAAVGFWVLGVPFALLLGCATALLSLVPMGAPVVWLTVVAYLTMQAAYGRAVILLLYGTFIISGVDNFLRPLIIGGRTRIPTVFLFFGILGGLQAYGMLGIFLGPVLIAILVAFLRIYREQYATSDTAADATPEA